MFFQCLSAIPFSDGSFNNVAVAEGLAEALMMFSSLNGSQTQQNADGQRHCILVAASNPHLLPTPVYAPVMQILEQSGNIEAHTSNGLADAETVAKAFPQCSVSLSVICPRKLPKLRAIYNAGKRDQQAADPPVDTSNNPNFLVLISENFNEACATFSHSEMESLAPNRSLVEMDMASVPPASGPSVMNQQPISAGNIPAATVNSEPTMVTSLSGPAPPQIPASQVTAGFEIDSATYVSEEMVPNNENTKETTPIVSVMTESLSPFSGVAANIGILNGVTSAIPAAPAVLTSGQQGVTSMTGFAPFGRTSQIAQNSSTVLTSGQRGVTSMSGFAPFARTDQIAQNSVPASLTSMAPSMSGNSNLSISQLLSNIQGGIGAGSQAAPIMSRGNDAKQDRHAPSQMMQSGIGMHQNMPSGMGTGMRLGIGAILATPGRTQQGQPGKLPLGRNNSAEANMSRNSNLCISQMLSNIQGDIGAGSQTAPVMSQGILHRSQMMQSGIGMHQNVQSGVDTGVHSGIGTMMPTSGRTQRGQPGMLPLGSNNSAEANMSLSQLQTLATLPSDQSPYVKFWEGNLYMQRLVERVTRLQGYKSASASESLGANWPPTMQIHSVISKGRMIELVGQRIGRADSLVFRVMEPHVLLNNLQEKNMCAVISLPSQTLYLCVSTKISRLIGLLFPSEDTEFKPTIPNQQLGATPLPQLPQQQRAQPLLEQLQQQRAQPLLAQFQQQRAQQLLARLQQQLHQQLPQDQSPRLLKRPHDGPLQQQWKVPRVHQQEIPEQQPIAEAAADQAYMQVTGRSQLMSQTQPSSPKDTLTKQRALKTD